MDFNCYTGNRSSNPTQGDSLGKSASEWTLAWVYPSCLVRESGWVIIVSPSQGADETLTYIVSIIVAMGFLASCNSIIVEKICNVCNVVTVVCVVLCRYYDEKNIYLMFWSISFQRNKMFKLKNKKRQNMIKYYIKNWLNMQIRELWQIPTINHRP